MKLAAALLAALALSPAATVVRAQQTAPAAPAPCTAEGAGVHYICGVLRPEDLVQVPGTDFIIGSGMLVANQPNSGGLHLIDRARKSAVKLDPRRRRSGPAPAGDTCGGEPDWATFGAHGLSIVRTGPDSIRLYVVNHGREAVEIFQVRPRAGAAPEVEWAGCLKGPEGAYMNSVAALPNGRVFVTEYYRPPLTQRDALAGRNTGGVQLWSVAGQVWIKLKNTDLPGANGIAVSPDGNTMFVAVTGTSSIARFDLTDQDKAPTMLRTDFRTDNLHFGSDGKLLLAGPGPATMDCASAPAGAQRCAQGPVVGALDPATMTLTIVKRGPAEPGFPGTSSAVIVGGELWLGSYQADRVAWQPVSP